MNSKRLLLIVNPISGTGSKAELIPKLEQRLADKQFMVTTHLTAGRGDATMWARNAVDSGYDVVAVCGGDGTVNEAARALSDTGMPMAILPAGSGNGLARHLGLVPDALMAVNAIEDANLIECDYGLANGDKFFCAFGMGFDAAVAQKFAQYHQRGLITYLRSAIQEFTKYRPKDYTITIDGETTLERKAYLVAVCNASQYGNNAFIAPNASITDGLFDVIIMHDAPHIQTLLAGLDMLTGMLPHNRQVEIIRAKSVHIHCDEPTPAHIDGEPLDNISEVNIKIVPGRLRVYGHQQEKPFTPFITPMDYVGRDITAALSRLFN